MRRYRELKIKRQFLSGTYSLDDLKDTNSLLLNKFQSQGFRAFQVKALPSRKIVYWSFSRRKANEFIKSAIKSYGYSVQFVDTIKPQSLDYSFSYSPNEYFISALIYCAFSLLLLFESEMYILFPSLILLAGFYCIYQYSSSKPPYNKALQQDK